MLVTFYCDGLPLMSGAPSVFIPPKAGDIITIEGERLRVESLSYKVQAGTDTAWRSKKEMKRNFIPQEIEVWTKPVR